MECHIRELILFFYYVTEWDIGEQKRSAERFLLKQLIQTVLYCKVILRGGTKSYLHRAAQFLCFETVTAGGLLLWANLGCLSSPCMLLAHAS